MDGSGYVCVCFENFRAVFPPDLMAITPKGYLLFIILAATASLFKINRMYSFLAILLDVAYGFIITQLLENSEWPKIKQIMAERSVPNMLNTEIQLVCWASLLYTERKQNVNTVER